MSEERRSAVGAGKASSPFQRSLFDPTKFTLTFELIPSRGGRSREIDRTLALAAKLADDRRIQAVSITENAGGQAALSPEVLGLEIKKMGLEIIVHFSGKDKNRNQMESLLFAWDRLGIRNLLVITGDYPQEGYRGYPKPVFDLDSVQMLDLLSRINRGSAGPHHRQAAISPTSFFMGVALSPFKRLEEELLPQYAKLHRKLAQGANYIITQVGYDARKFHEVLLYLKERQIGLPVLGNVFIPNLAVSKLMHQGKIPGCVITDRLYARIQQEAESPDHGKKARLLRGAELLAIMKGLGYAGAHIGGPGLDYDDLDFLLQTAEELAGKWQDLVAGMDYWLEDGFYLYRKDRKTGLNSTEPSPLSPARKGPALGYRLADSVHQLAFRKEAPLYPLCRKFFRGLAASRLEAPFSRLEYLAKYLLFDCRNCGDCALSDLAFICPQADCAKYLLNGPCGGSRDGWCEVYPGKKRCFYLRVYQRLKAVGLSGELADGFVPPRNWALNESSSWANFFLGLDHKGEESGPQADL